MSKVTCDVIKDLIPLYVDDVLSEDSKTLVDEHLEGCAGCMDYYNSLKEPDKFMPETEFSSADGKAVSEKADEGKRVIKGIKKRITIRKIITAFITAVAAMALLIGIYYFLKVREIYIPYQDSGIYVQNNVIKTDALYHCSYGIYTPDGEDCFIFLTTTLYNNLTEDHEDVMIQEMSDQGKPRTIGSIDEESDLSCNQIYYVNEETAKKYKKGYYMMMTEENIKELKDSSVLVWERE